MRNSVCKCCEFTRWYFKAGPFWVKNLFLILTKLSSANFGRKSFISLTVFVWNTTMLFGAALHRCIQSNQRFYSRQCFLHFYAWCKICSIVRGFFWRSSQINQRGTWQPWSQREASLAVSGHSHHDGQTSSHHLKLFISDHQDQVPVYMNMSDCLTLDGQCTAWVIWADRKILFK